MNEKEEGEQLQIDFGKLARVSASCSAVVPVAIQDADTGKIILVAYTNEQAFRQAMRERKLVLWSTSRNELWEKGKTSGETFELLEAYVNCEQNSLLYRVRPNRGGVCHTRNRKNQARNCFYRRIRFDSLALENIDP
ncbi:MAG: phosphoribosyl-AMP cyclohydrolase [Kiritimatiellae bacterium]|nr:phosphoribosyl-AMP cyclohydrolase [Kiritimatiellia bacterium]